MLLQRPKRGHVQLLIKKENATTAENAGIKKFNLLYMENTKMFKHPNYYKNLRKLARLRNRDQAISLRAHDGERERAPGTGHKLQAREDSTANSTRGQVAEPQASSVKPQAPEASSDKHQAPSSKRQA